MYTRLEQDPYVMQKLHESNELHASSNIGCCMQCIPLFIFLTLVSRLEVSTFSTFLILLPIFAIIGCCLCTVCCGLCYLSNVDAEHVGDHVDDSGGSSSSAGELIHKDEGGKGQSHNYQPPPIIPADDIESGGAVHVTAVQSDYGTFEGGKKKTEVKQEIVEARNVEIDIE